VQRQALATLILLALAAAVLAPMGPVGAEPGTAGPCGDGAGVTVVVDAQELSDRGPATQCAPGGGRDGLEVLKNAGVEYQTASRSPGFVCKVARLPVEDPCQDPSPADAYWSYWLARRGGSWCLSNKGAAGRSSPAGTVEGWSFAKGRQDSGPVPPRPDPPAPVPGTVPAQLASGDCDSTTRTGVTSTTVAAPNTTPTQPARSRSTVAPGPAGAPVTTSFTAPTTSVAAADAVQPTTTAALAEATDATTVLAEASGPPVTIDVSPPRGGGGARPALGAAGLVVALGGMAGVVARRRRRAAPNDEILV